MKGSRKPGKPTFALNQKNQKMKNPFPKGSTKHACIEALNVFGVSDYKRVHQTICENQIDFPPQKDDLSTIGAALSDLYRWGTLNRFKGGVSNNYLYLPPESRDDKKAAKLRYNKAVERVEEVKRKYREAKAERIAQAKAEKLVSFKEIPVQSEIAYTVIKTPETPQKPTISGRRCVSMSPGRGCDLVVVGAIGAIVMTPDGVTISILD